MKHERDAACYTTGEVARRCRVTKRTVIKWIDGGRLPGYTIPGSTHRRVSAVELADFMRRHGIPDFDGSAPRRRVFIVDDDADFVEVLRQALGVRYDVQAAGTALEAASRLPGFRPDVILLDIRLPDVDGLSVARHLASRADGPHAPILCMSAYGHEVTLQQVKKTGAEGFIAKPVKLHELKRRIASMVG